MLEKAGLSLGDFDGIAEWQAETLEDILAIFVSEEYKEVSKCRVAAY